MTDSARELPTGWAQATIPALVGSAGVFSDGDWIETKDQDPNGQVRLVQLADVGDGFYRNRSSRFLTAKKAAELGCTFLEPGDVLIARMPDPLGRACIFRGDPKSAVTAVDVCIVRTGAGGSSHRWLMWCVNSPEFRTQIADLQKGSTRQRISRKNLATIPLPVPPLPEQTRIASHVDAQLSRLDAAIAALRHAHANVEAYRASVLKAACEGRLVPTEAELARAEGREYEPADQLVERILEMRELGWQSRPSNASARRSDRAYKRPAEPAVRVDRQPPRGWAIASLEQLTSAVRVIRYGILMPKEHIPDGVMYVRVKDIAGDRVALASLKRTSREIARQYERASLAAGDLLLAIRGTYGRVAEVPAQLAGGNITQDTARLAMSPLIDRRFIRLQLMSPESQRYFKRVARGVAVKGVNIADVRPTPIMLPPLAEQGRIVAEVERRLSVADEAETTIEAALTRAERLRQAILKRAFEGKLVPQDLNDEPASVLLERIRKQREAEAKTRPSKRGLGRVRAPRKTRRA